MVEKAWTCLIKLNTARHSDLTNLLKLCNMQLGRKDHGDKIGQFFAIWATFGCPFWLCVKMKKPNKMVTFWATFSLYKFLTNNKKFQSKVWDFQNEHSCRYFGIGFGFGTCFGYFFQYFGYFFPIFTSPWILYFEFIKPPTVNKTLNVIMSSEVQYVAVFIIIWSSSGLESRYINFYSKKGTLTEGAGSVQLTSSLG